MQREEIIRELERSGGRVDCGFYIGALILNYGDIEIDIQIGPDEIPVQKGRKFARLDSVEDAQVLIESIAEKT